MAPTQKLVVTGPYKLCRNPIQFGAILYYLGVGTASRGLGCGLFMAVSAAIIGSLYHRFVEEKELEKRFGRDYVAYRARTPFLLPFGSRR
jgi:protein-S-isoprenylcysteine O-methyltransferase Ste14